MNTQVPVDTNIHPCRPFILLYLLFLMPCFLSANPVTSSENVFIQNKTAKVMFCAAQWQDGVPVNDTTQNPSSTATSSDYLEATYPGGASAWMMNIMRTFRYPPEAFKNNIQGTVVVTFLVDAKGRVKKPEAIGGSKELREEAIRVIRQSGKWIPAKTHGEFVESYKQQTVIFKREGS